MKYESPFSGLPCFIPRGTKYAFDDSIVYKKYHPSLIKEWDYSKRKNGRCVHNDKVKQHLKQYQRPQSKMPSKKEKRMRAKPKYKLSPPHFSYGRFYLC